MSKKRQRLWIPEHTYEISSPERGEVRVGMPETRIAGWFDVELIDAATNQIKKRYHFPNVITIHAMNAMGSGISTMTTLYDRLFVGTGSTTPTPSDLTLEASVGSTTSDGGFGDVIGYVTGSPHGPFLLGNPYHFRRITRVFIESEVNFSLTELGFRDIITSPNIQLNRALFKDSGGTPITITKTSVDQLKITYEMRLYPPTYHTSGSFVLANSETSHSWTASGVDIDNSSNWGFVFGGGPGSGWFRLLGTWVNGLVGRSTQPFASASIPGNPTGTVTDWGWSGAQDNAGGNASRSLFPYTCGSFFRRQLASWEPSVANFGSGGIQAIGHAYTFGFQMGVYFTPSIKKTDTDSLSLVFDTFFSASVTSSS